MFVDTKVRAAACMNLCVCNPPPPFQESSIPSAQTLSLLEFSFSDYGMPDSATTQATVRMFLDLNLVQDFNIDYKVLKRHSWDCTEDAADI